VRIEATDEYAELFSVVVGSVMENFAGVRVVEYIDDTFLTDPDRADALAALHETLTGDDRLTAEQRTELEEFRRKLEEGDGTT
jgi:hypothetical protein